MRQNFNAKQKQLRLFKHSSNALMVQDINMSIEDFGKMVENLLVELTIAQTDGNNKVIEILN